MSVSPPMAESATLSFLFYSLLDTGVNPIRENCSLTGFTQIINQAGRRKTCSLCPVRIRPMPSRRVYSEFS